MLLDAIRTARDLGRLHDVATVLVRHGLGDLVRRLGIARILRRAGRTLHWHAAAEVGTQSTPEHVRAALEELGPTFVKAGQLLADRTDLLPPAWTDELARLRQRASPVPWEAIRAQLVADLGDEPERVFAAFDATPIAAASIAQVYRAELPAGAVVAVKVRRPGIVDVVAADLRLLQRLAEAAEREFPELRRYQPVQLVRRLSASLRAEMDLRSEARNAARLRADLASHRDLRVPAIHDQFTRDSLCVMEFLEGESLEDWLATGTPDRVEGRRLAEIGAAAVLDMVLERGFFHADPHPGNLYRLADGRLGLLDFGMVGRLSDSRRREVFELVLAGIDGSAERVADVLLDWSRDGDANFDLLVGDSADFVDRYRDVPLAELDVGALLADVAALMRDNDLDLPGDVAMLLKVFVTIDHVGRLLDPDFVTAAVIDPYVQRAARRHRSPFRLMRQGLRDSRGVLLALPRHAQRLLRQLRRGRLGIDVGLPHLDGFGLRLDRAANRLTFGMITAALIVGTAITMTVSSGPSLFGLPAFGLFGFTSSLVAGLWVLWSIARSGKR